MSARPATVVLVATCALLSLIWGTTWAVIRIGLAGMPPFTAAALRFSIAGSLLLVLAWRRGIPLGRRPWERRLWCINGVGSFAVNYGVVYWAEQWIPSGLASVLFALMPLLVTLMAHFALPGERLRPWALLGTLLGFAGVGTIFSEDLSQLGGPGVPRAALVMLLSPLAMAVTQVALKRWGAGIHPLSLTAVPMLIGASLLGATAALVERDLPVAFTPVAIGSVVYLAVIGSAVTFSLYYWLLSHMAATKTSLIAYTTPLVAVLVGTFGLGEALTGRILAGGALVVAGVAAASLAPRSR